MNTWHRPRTTARVASTLLLIWLLAVVASWANACVLDPIAGHANQAAESAGLLHEAAPHASGGEHHGDAGHAACLERCDGERRVIPKTSAAAVPDLVAVPLFAIVQWSPVVQAASPMHKAAPTAAPPPERPVAIHFSRLTI